MVADPTPMTGLAAHLTARRHVVRAPPLREISGVDRRGRFRIDVPLRRLRSERQSHAQVHGGEFDTQEIAGRKDIT
jgi:hypothetical protein